MRGQQSTTLQQNHKRNTLQSTRQSSSVGKSTYNRGKMLLGLAIVLAFTLPIFRSGLKSNLTFFQFMINHTIFGDPVEFIPKEDYEQAFADE